MAKQTKSLEQAIKDQYAKVFKKRDWEGFKSIAEYYLIKAASLKRSDIDADGGYALLIRNIQKRLFLGISCELLIKACYLNMDLLLTSRRIKTINSQLLRLRR